MNKNKLTDVGRFVTTSDDKTIRAWDYDIPVVIKYIAERVTFCIKFGPRDMLTRWI